MSKQQITTTLRNFGDVDEALLKLAGYETEIKKEEASLNEKMQLLRDESDRKINSSRTHKSGIEIDIENFCTLNKNEFEKVRTRDLVHGSVGFRTTPPKVSLLNRKYTWDTVLELLERVGLKKFIRQKAEIDKDSILTEVAAGTVKDEKLAACGIKIDQGEKFGYDIKWETIQN